MWNIITFLTILGVIILVSWLLSKIIIGVSAISDAVSDDQGKGKEAFSPRLLSEKRDKQGNVIEQTMYAMNSREASKHLNGYTISGDRSIVVSRVGQRTYRIHVKDRQ